MAELSKRLTAIAERIPIGASVADIGTDHAYLPIYLRLAGKVRRMIACDVNKGPLLCAARNIAESTAREIELRLGDGLSVVMPEEVDTVVIAGMGGEIIADIIAGAPWIKIEKTRLILQPMTSGEDLRRFLSAEGFAILEEFAVADAGRVYAVIVAVYDGICGAYTETQAYIGKMCGATPAERTYIEKQHRRLADMAESIRPIPEKRGEYEAALRCVREIEQVLSGGEANTGESD